MSCGQSCDAVLTISHECMEPLTLHFTCGDDPDDWDLDFRLPPRLWNGEAKLSAWGRSHVGNVKSPTLNGISGNFEMNCR
eukprot:303719-Amphidinium_carterae.1